MYNKLTAEFEIVTPMFIGDGRQKATGIRPSSVKGALRFWWRALNWDRIFRQLDSESSAIKQLYNEEIALFGCAVDNQKGGPGVVSVRVKQQKIERYNWGVLNNKDNGLAYLLGIGLFKYKEPISTESLTPDNTFSLDLVLKGASQEQKTQLIDVVKLFGLIGGMGARNRKGFGSVAIKHLFFDDQPQNIPVTKDEYKAELKRLFSTCKNSVELAPLTAFSGLTESDISLSDSSWKSCLQSVGTIQQIYRSYGRKTGSNNTYQVAGKRALQLFRDDHDLIFNFIINAQIDSPPKRIIFGLPHNYFFSSKKQNVEITGSDKDSKRRASPLFIHIHKFSDNTYAAIQTLIPAQFYPDKLEFYMKGRRESLTKVGLTAQDIDWQVIRDYMRLDRYKSASNLSYPGFVDREIITTQVSEGKADHE